MHDGQCPQLGATRVEIISDVHSSGYATKHNKPSPAGRCPGLGVRSTLFNLQWLDEPLGVQ